MVRPSRYPLEEVRSAPVHLEGIEFAGGVRSLVRAALIALAALSVVVFVAGGLVWWVWAVWMWNDLYGLIGIGIGVLTISDLALPFLWEGHAGSWPRAWVGTLAGLVAVRVAGVGAAWAAEAVGGRR
jgi:hypothetical protein